ncbi:MAG: cyclase family protein [Pirellulaceae bacterium]|jgi:kynurenine formamidase|nr:cyclase family protein [Pirellulaceae bacterium]MDP7019321.1 cyclase family protein [Pirellulaceae bacterium]
MRNRQSRLWVIGLLTFSILGGVAYGQRPQITADDVEKMAREVSNWGRWGKDDQLGAINLITPAKRREAATLVKSGISVSLAHDVEKKETADNPDPFKHEMLLVGRGTQGQWSVDNYSVSYHGFAHTHLDSLCHLFHRGKMYNGFSRDEVGPNGAAKLSIHNFKQGIFTRGVLIDIPRLRGVRYLEPGDAIYPEELDKWERETGIKVSSGDVVMLRTGRWARRKVTGPWAASDGMAGLHVTCAKWLRKRDVAVLGSDAAADVMPSGVDGVTHPIHLLTLNAMGMPILDNCNLEEVGETAAKLKRWEFLLTAAPLAVEGGTGSPLNPIATF